MPRDEVEIVADLDPGLASFIKHGYHHHIRWPVLDIGVVMANTTTAVNEEWLTAVEHMPTRKVLHAHTSAVLRREVGFCVHLNKRHQEGGEGYVTMADFDFYLLPPEGPPQRVEKPAALRQTLLHTFQEYRMSNEQAVELVAFSSGTVVNDALVARLTFLDAEVFNREYGNVRPVLRDGFRGEVPFIAVAPRGRLTFFVERYPWFDNAAHFAEVMDVLEGALVSDVHSHSVNTDPTVEVEGASTYNVNSGVIHVKDVLTMCVVRFFGCDARLDSYHRFDMARADTAVFLRALADALAQLRARAAATNPRK
ncbi:DNA-dependent RNA polymerase subunit rpo35 [Squirrelpox virus]|uniref:DNA-directed RNA polymerase 35 kDa subunit n=2 Tax=Squirrelpox virus TaxID=240426 RepID=Q1HTR7_9POXV|nr:DNA-dependent RNA polymerase subunit rpo35 [Squirrelpox virus]ABD51469.1 O4L [Squirrelpox virus]CCD83301.1 DNA-dependent RNA polymerase subunit rpo35 [Squirrelpox virus]